MDDLLRNTLSQLTLGAVDKIAPEAIGTLMGLPPGATSGVVAASTMLLKGAAQTAVLNTYDDIFHRQISTIEASKAEYSFKRAENTFWEFVEKEGAEDAGYKFDAYSPEYESARQAAEGFLLQSMREFEHKKLDVLGRYYGRNLYYGNNYWESIYQTQKMIERLTFRQLVLIRLISERFPGQDQEECITAPDACVEVMDLLNYGIWRAPGAFLSQDNSQPIRLKSLEPTAYAVKLNEELMLNDISVTDINHVLSTLAIKQSNSSNQTLTTDEVSDIKDSLASGGDVLDKVASNTDLDEIFDRVKSVEDNQLSVGYDTVRHFNLERVNNDENGLLSTETMLNKVGLYNVFNILTA